MPNIPLVQRGLTQTGERNIRLSSGAFMAQGAAITQAGDALQRVGGMLAQVAVEKKRLEGEKAVDSEQLIRLNVADQVNQVMEQNKATPEKWGKLVDDVWRSYESGRNERIKGWSERAKAVESQQLAEFRTRSQIQFRAREAAAIEAASNSTKTALAEQYLRNGDVQSAVNTFDTLSVTPEDKERIVREKLSEGLFKTAQLKMTEADGLPPAHRVSEINTFIADLEARNESGAYLNYEYGRGGLSAAGRVALRQEAEAKINAAERRMAVTAGSLAAAIRGGKATAAQVDSMLKAGEIDEQTARDFAPEFYAAQGEFSAKQEAKAQREQQVKEARQATASGQLERQIIDRQQAGAFEIERAVASGQISATQGAEIRARLSAQAEAEQSRAGGVFAKIQSSIESNMGGKLMGTDPSPETYEALRKRISEAQLSQPSKLKLWEKFFALKASDLANNEEDMPDTVFDRKISRVEAKARVDFQSKLKASAEMLGPDSVGDLLFASEPKIRAFFEANPSATEADAAQFMETQILPEVKKAAGKKTIGGAFWQ